MHRQGVRTVHRTKSHSHKYPIQSKNPTALETRYTKHNTRKLTYYPFSTYTNHKNQNHQKPPKQQPRKMRRYTPFTFQAHAITLATKSLRMMMLTMSILWFATIIISRIYVFHNAYIHHMQTKESNQWLLIQCDDPAFYANLGQHVDICTNVREKDRESILLAALNDTLLTASLCGTMDCFDILTHLQSGGLSLVSTIALILVIITIIIIPTLHTGYKIITDFKYHREWNTPCLERGPGNTNNALQTVPPSLYRQSPTNQTETEYDPYYEAPFSFFGKHTTSLSQSKKLV